MKLILVKKLKEEYMRSSLIIAVYICYMPMLLASLAPHGKNNTLPNQRITASTLRLSIGVGCPQDIGEIYDMKILGNTFKSSSYLIARTTKKRR